MKRSVLLMVPLLAALALGACSSGSSSSSSSSDTPTPTADPAIYATRQYAGLAVQLLAAFKAENPGTTLAVKPGLGSTIVKILNEKYPGIYMLPTVIVPAANKSASNTVGATELELAVPAKDPKITSVAQFRAAPANRRMQCVLYVPADCVAKANQMLASGAIDAAVLWRSGAPLPPGVKKVSIPADKNLVIGASSVKVGDNSATRAFDDFLGSDAAKQILRTRGLLP